jgi:hypothetical protein
VKAEATVEKPEVEEEAKAEATEVKPEVKAEN